MLEEKDFNINEKIHSPDGDYRYEFEDYYILDAVSILEAESAQEKQYNAEVIKLLKEVGAKTSEELV